MKKILIIILTLFCIFNIYGQSSSENLITTFFDKFEKEGSNSAIDYIYSTNKSSNVLKNEVDELKTKLTKTIELLGKYHGYEYIVSKSVGTSLILYSYLIKYDRQPIRFTFILYKADNEWALFNFLYDAKFDEELKEAAKVYRLLENIPLIPNNK
ncbi:MAG: hypothetical protein HXX18_11805 [Bacteroidetes bacterium]|nr:hypothetical protein [Bacteroidota bacterium]